MENITLYAEWEVSSGESPSSKPMDKTEYIMTFKSGSGSAVSAVNVTHGKRQPNLPPRKRRDLP
ncbi:MAG: hypothetical protein LBC13_02235 [Clostridiales bacterium]|jgi:hypothetical protein|nr:hypothetical protein [Clostridiales bacterium]